MTFLAGDKTMIFFNVLIPVLQFAILNKVIGVDPKDIQVGVVNLERPGDLSPRFVQALEDEGLVPVTFDTEEDALRKIEKAKLYGALVIPANFSRIYRLKKDEFLVDSLDNETLALGNIRVFQDNTNRVFTWRIGKSVNDAYMAFTRQVSLEAGENENSLNLPINFDRRVSGERDPEHVEFTATAALLQMAYYQTQGLTTIALTGEKRQGILERSGIVGISTTLVLLSHVATQTVMMCFQNCLAMATAFWVLDLPRNGPMWVAVLLMFVEVKTFYGIFSPSVLFEAF